VVVAGTVVVDEGAGGEVEGAEGGDDVSDVEGVVDEEGAELVVVDSTDEDVLGSVDVVVGGRVDVTPVVVEAGREVVVVVDVEPSVVVVVGATTVLMTTVVVVSPWQAPR
jgi:hypothetical protein